ncbi:MAG: hypothetical protein ABI068_17195 [Ktedonobacterales bacterium]
MIAVAWRLGTSDSAAFMPYLQALLLLLLLAIIAGAISSLLLTILIVIWAVAAARSNLRGLPSLPAGLAWHWVKDMLVSNTVHMVLWVIPLALVFCGIHIWVAIVIGSLCQLLVTTLRATNQVILMRWLYPSTPIQQTEWAQLGQRIQA